jgi:hypothetical protein
MGKMACYNSYPVGIQGILRSSGSGGSVGQSKSTQTNAIRDRIFHYPVFD